MAPLSHRLGRFLVPTAWCLANTLSRVYFGKSNLLWVFEALSELSVSNNKGILAIIVKILVRGDNPLEHHLVLTMRTNGWRLYKLVSQSLVNVRSQ